ncbi:MAG TPA: biotin--[acetyl-CoA-carboxylase] ligase [Longimicrobiales bacterium]
MTGGHELAAWEGRPIEAWREAWRAPALTVLDVTGSTNDVARALAEAGAPAGTAVLAERQTAGRGRGGRSWHAPPGSSLLLSVILRPRGGGPDGPAPGAIPLRMGMAVIRAAERVADLHLGLKWPNDVVAPGAGKVAGILCEGAVGGAGGFVVVGIGVNVRQREVDFPPEIRSTATSLERLAGREISRAALCGAIMEEIRAAAARHAAPLDPPELDRIARHDVLRGRHVTVDGRPRGTAAGLAPDGALLIETPDGRIAAVYTGTVRLRDGETLGAAERNP